MKCAICYKLSESVYGMTLFEPDFEVRDAVTIMKGHAVCEAHFDWLDSKVASIASEISREAGERHRSRNASW